MIRNYLNILDMCEEVILGGNKPARHAEVEAKPVSGIGNPAAFFKLLLIRLLTIPVVVFWAFSLLCICDIAFDIASDDVGSVLGEQYDQLLLDELEKLQGLVLLLTEVVTQGIGSDEHSDEAESVFSAGELTSEMGSKSHDKEDE